VGAQMAVCRGSIRGWLWPFVAIAIALAGELHHPWLLLAKGAAQAGFGGARVRVHRRLRARDASQVPPSLQPLPPIPAAPSHGGTVAGAANDGGKSQAAALVPAPACPGVVRGVCTLPCQRRTCEHLAAFFRLTNNETQPWHSAGTWEVTRKSPCASIVAAGAAAAGRPPPYCSWLGVACCDVRGVAAGLCGVVHAAANLSIRADNVNGSVSDPALMDAIEGLHACGLVGLDLESNDVAGELGPRWGRLKGLMWLNLGAG
jgi:hypothetical protein